ncbi:phospholipid phosphatase 5 isoform X1 [Eupeodes corollae]|uniref:phospholipid phosphatase 5 isoform X1 n=1 Tax=Eupeodes corollae TaxID=290404 RepID=UPI002492E2EF|nr:phospholipid phosphatase 5 isoform X1 [Eupeodes corollae]XP_055903339.1 phospholipid phosphatase 5 isoform X1 [Eupeodes corollae]
MLSSSSSSSPTADQDVKLRHRNTMTASATTTRTPTSTSPDLDTGKAVHSSSGAQDTFLTEEKFQIKELLIEEQHCRGKPSDLVSNSSSSANAQPHMAQAHRRQTLSESSDESHSNQLTTIGDCMEYRNKSAVDTMRSNTLQRQTSSNNATGATTLRSSTTSRYINLFMEIAIRVLLCYGTVKFERTIAFKRIIHPEEVWLYKNPISKDYVPASTALFWIIFAPLVLIFSNFLMSRNKRDFRQATYAFTLGLVMNGFFTSLIKVSVGRPRPDFFYRCFPDGVMGESFEKCTGDEKVIEEGRKSFPSGHSSMTFAAFGFMSFFLASKLHVFNERGRGQSWRLCISLVPLLVALEVAISRTCDYHHHWQDVLVGSLLGICVSYLCYRQYFPSIFSKNCHRPYSSRDKYLADQKNCFANSALNADADHTDENQPLISAEKENKWI